MFLRPQLQRRLLRPPQQAQLQHWVLKVAHKHRKTFL
jgi:hypothetical protein